jgi:predicted RNase H-like HicB family nuclease
MKKIRKPISADRIAKLATDGKDVSRFFTNERRMVYPSPKNSLGTKRAAAQGFNNLTVHFYREVDHRWLADIPALPGVTAYGKTRTEAMAAAQVLALRLIADRLEHGEAIPGEMQVSFIAA